MNFKTAFRVRPACPVGFTHSIIEKMMQQKARGELFKASLLFKFVRTFRKKNYRICRHQQRTDLTLLWIYFKSRLRQKNNSLFDSPFVWRVSPTGCDAKQCNMHRTHLLWRHAPCCSGSTRNFEKKTAKNSVAGWNTQRFDWNFETCLSTICSDKRSIYFSISK